METQDSGPVKRSTFWKKLLWILGILVLLVSAVSIYFYNNFNQLLADALMKSFNSGVISDVYELKFDKLSVNLLVGSIQVHNVEMKPRQTPLASYPYINSSMELHAKKILLFNVEIFTLLKTNILRLKSVEFMEPEIEMKLMGSKLILFPFRDTTNSTANQSADKKGFIEALLLKEFRLVNASIHFDNKFRQRELAVKNLSITLTDLMLKQDPGRDLISNKQVDLSIGEIVWRLKNSGVQSIRISEYKLKMDSLNLINSADTLIYRFSNFTTGLKVFNMQTADSLFNLSMQSFNLSYRDKSITLKGIKFDPNISDAAMQRRYKYQTPIFAGSVGRIKLDGLNFDSLIYKNKILIDDLDLDKLSVTIFKDQTKPLDKNKFPKYPGQQVRSINLPIYVRHLNASNVNLVNSEKKPDGDVGRVVISRMTIDAKNITTLPTSQPLSVNADGFIENKAHAMMAIQFSYDAPQFTVNGKVQKFNLPDINRFLKSYTPATITKGVADEVNISANVYRTGSTGTMKFLYHDLEADLELKNQAKWKSDLLSFVGNTIVASSNPTSSDMPAKVVSFKVDRDMNKGFINVIIKSVLAGFKETVMMSKENRKSYKEAKKKKSKQDKKAKQ